MKGFAFISFVSLLCSPFAQYNWKFQRKLLSYDSSRDCAAVHWRSVAWVVLKQVFGAVIISHMYLLARLRAGIATNTANIGTCSEQVLSAKIKYHKTKLDVGMQKRRFIGLVQQNLDLLVTLAISGMGVGSGSNPVKRSQVSFWWPKQIKICANCAAKLGKPTGSSTEDWRSHAMGSNWKASRRAAVATVQWH